MVLAEAGEQGTGALASGGAGGPGEAWDGKQLAAPTLPSQGPGEETAAPWPASQRAGLITCWCGRKAALGNSREDAEIRAMKAANLILAPPTPPLLSLGEVIHIYELIIPANHPTSHTCTNSQGSGSYIVIRRLLCHRRGPPKDDRGRPGAEHGRCGRGWGRRNRPASRPHSAAPSGRCSPQGLTCCSLGPHRYPRAGAGQQPAQRHKGGWLATFFGGQSVRVAKQARYCALCPTSALLCVEP